MVIGGVNGELSTSDLSEGGAAIVGGGEAVGGGRQVPQQVLVGGVGRWTKRGDGGDGGREW